MATISKVSICNMALLKIGQARISSLTETGSKSAASCNLIYDQMVRETLEEYNWSFARKRVALALVESDPTDNWSYSYAVPTDMVRARFIERTYGLAEVAYELEDDLLYTNEADAVLVYTSSVTDPSKFSAGFVRVLVLRLALDLSTVLLDSESAVVDLFKLYRATLREVCGRDASQQSQQVVPEDPYISIRS